MYANVNVPALWKWLCEDVKWWEILFQHVLATDIVHLVELQGQMWLWLRKYFQTANFLSMILSKNSYRTSFPQRRYDIRKLSDIPTQTPIVAPLRDQLNRHTGQITSEQCFFPLLDLYVMSSSLWQNLPILGVIIFNTLCRGKKRKNPFIHFWRNGFCNLFAGFWWDLVVWPKMRRDRQQVSDPDIKQWRCWRMGVRPRGTLHRDAHTCRHTALYAYTQACTEFPKTYI